MSDPASPVDAVALTFPLATSLTYAGQPATFPEPPAPTAAAPASAAPHPALAGKFSSARVLALVGEPVRHRLLSKMVDGTPWSAAQAARALGRKRSTLSKHFGALAKARIIIPQRSPRDGRQCCYVLAPELRPADPASRTVDFGGCVVRFPG